MVLFQRHAPGGEWSQIHRQAEERQQQIRLQRAGLAGEGGNRDGFQRAAGTVQRMELVGMTSSISPSAAARASCDAVSGEARNLARRWTT